MTWNISEHVTLCHRFAETFQRTSAVEYNRVQNTMPKSNSAFLEFVRQVVIGNIEEVSRRLTARPSFATASSDVGATRQDASTHFFSEIAHYLFIREGGRCFFRYLSFHPQTTVLFPKLTKLLMDIHFQHRISLSVFLTPLPQQVHI